MLRFVSNQRKSRLIATRNCLVLDILLENNLQHLLISQKHPSLTDKELKFHP